MKLYGWEDARNAVPSGDASFVLHSDYLKIKEALREALDRWQKWPLSHKTSKRIAELRKEFDL
jgi:hypothetical protein